MKVPESRIRSLCDRDPAPDGRYVLYWMVAARRPADNFALDHAIEWARSLNRPLVVFEALRCDYPWASDRLHRFVIEGMQANARAFQASPVLYRPFVERARGQGRGLLEALARDAAVVVSDDYPAFFIPRMLARASEKIPTRFDLVDSNGVLPMRSTDRCFQRAFDFRRQLQKTLLPHLMAPPSRRPFEGVSLPVIHELPADDPERWPPGLEIDLARLPIDHGVAGAVCSGGLENALARWDSFRADGLLRYAEDRNHPDGDGASGLSPWLHFGHVSSHRLISDLLGDDAWTPERIIAKAKGQRTGFWGLSEAQDSFFDELVTWRELGFNMCAHSPQEFDRFESLPAWAKTSLDQHRTDPREPLYSSSDLEHARTHDDIWNAAQRELVLTGRVHNYLRMLWGKKILEWSPTPEAALERMIELNNKYALDGRDPNSYSGIFWVLGRYDRAWGPERPIFGKIRYMSSDSTRRKLRLKKYLERFGAPQATASGQLEIGLSHR